MKKLRAGSRESRLAVVQTRLVADYIQEALPEAEVCLVTMKTTGDRILDRPLEAVGGKGLFVKELDAALLDGRVDLTVHSCKDLPMDIDERIPLAGFTRREDPRDVLVLPQGVTELDRSRPIGCASARRAVQLKELFPGVDIAPVRGNVLTRLRKLDEGQYSALVLAAAGLKRLGLEERIARDFTVDELLPAAVEVVLETGQASVSMLQRRLKLGYSRAARLVDQMEEKGVVGPFEGSKPRQVLITKEQWQEMQFKQGMVDAAPAEPVPDELPFEGDAVPQERDNPPFDL